MSARQFGMHHRTVVPENFERPPRTAEELEAESADPLDAETE
ncbi:hypothetical protein ACFPYI_04790 [Halomarina salina]|uniref:Uncharacterized protein n=1 Tax=Halomarina salina TaxID=1872699 RepID=A0ABD5RJW3_9EURY|nr:hypothetical protein [Halomarina salina]